MRTYLTAAILGLGTLYTPATADASWFSEALRNTHIHVVAPVAPVYPAYVPPPVVAYPPPCARPAYVVPVYEPNCYHGQPVYVSPRPIHHDHHHSRHYRR